jgi:hypothetical protein
MTKGLEEETPGGSGSVLTVRPSARSRTACVCTGVCTPPPIRRRTAWIASPACADPPTVTLQARRGSNVGLQHLLDVGQSWIRQPREAVKASSEDCTFMTALI